MNDGTGGYFRLVASIFYKEPDAEDIAAESGIGRQHITWGRPASSLWPDIIDRALREKRFVALHAAIRSRTPADIRDKLDQLSEAVTFRPTAAAEYGAQSWYKAPDPCLARLVGPMAQRAVFNRLDLRACCSSLTEGLAVVFIVGDRRSGRSHSWFLLQHVALSVGCVPLLVDIAEVNTASKYKTADLMSDITDQLGIDGLDVTIRDMSLPDTAARILVNRLVGRAPRDGIQRWLFIDGIDRPNVEPDTVLLVESLAVAVQAGRLPSIQLIVSGYAGPLLANEAFRQGLERIQPIGRTEVEGFFRDVADHLDAPVTQDFVDALMAEFYEDLADPDNLAMLEPRAARMARNVLAGVT